MSDPSLCSGRALYIANDQLELCTETCTLVQSDPTAQLEVLYGCVHVSQ